MTESLPCFLNHMIPCNSSIQRHVSRWSTTVSLVPRLRRLGTRIGALFKIKFWDGGGGYVVYLLFKLKSRLLKFWYSIFRFSVRILTHIQDLNVHLKIQMYVGEVECMHFRLWTYVRKVHNICILDFAYIWEFKCRFKDCLLTYSTSFQILPCHCLDYELLWT